MQINNLRYFLFFGWIATALLVCGAYVASYLHEAIRASEAVLGKSLMAVVGLLTPHLTIAATFIFGTGVEDSTYVGRQRGLVMICSCLIYWTLLIILVWGTVFWRLLGDGTAIDLATSLITTFAGVFSFLAVTPTAHVFAAKPGTSRKPRAPSSRDRPSALKA
jgi:hypothetical protein